MKIAFEARRRAAEVDATEKNYPDPPPDATPLRRRAPVSHPADQSSQCHLEAAKQSAPILRRSLTSGSRV